MRTDKKCGKNFCDQINISSSCKISREWLKNMHLAGEQKSVLVAVLLLSVVSGSRDLCAKKTSHTMMQEIYPKKLKAEALQSRI